MRPNSRERHRVMSRIEPTPIIVASLRKHAHQHKYDHGHLLVLSGPSYQTGAARLAAKAGLRVGAGLVTMAAAKAVMPVLAVHLTEIMLQAVSTGADLTELLARDERINALCLGPALGLDDRAAELVEAAIASKRPCVLDADALTALSKNPELRRGLHAGCVLTPHAGEFARLFPDIPIGETTTAGIAAIEAAADAVGCTVLLKGAISYISAPQERAAMLDSSKTLTAPWLATAGSGDVLAGLIGGLMARGLHPTDASEAATLLHTMAARSFGPGLIAGDLPDMIPGVFKDLGV